MEKRNYGCKYLDGRDAIGINEITAKVQQGAIIYIDDFVGSGNQFNRARFSWNVVGSFSEFLLVPSICEESYAKLNKTRPREKPEPVQRTLEH